MKKFFSILLIAMLVVVGCGKKENKKGQIETCPGCVFLYPDSPLSWGFEGTLGITKLTSDKYEEDWKKLVSETGKNIFVGVSLNDDDTISKAYGCYTKGDEAYCLEGTVPASVVTEWEKNGLKFVGSSVESVDEKNISFLEQLNYKDMDVSCSLGLGSNVCEYGDELEIYYGNALVIITSGENQCIVGGTPPLIGCE